MDAFLLPVWRSFSILLTMSGTLTKEDGGDDEEQVTDGQAEDALYTSTACQSQPVDSFILARSNAII